MSSSMRPPHATANAPTPGPPAAGSLSQAAASDQQQHKPPSSKGVRGGGGKRGRSISPVPPTATSSLDAMTQAALSTAAQHCQAAGYKGTAECLLKNTTTANPSTSAAIACLPTVDQVRQAAAKAIAECPPWIHWSKADMAPQLKCIDPPLADAVSGGGSTSASAAVWTTSSGSTTLSSATPAAATTTTARLTLTAGTMRGYRMARASHGMNSSSSSSSSSSNSNFLIGYYYECKWLPGPTAREIAAALPPNARLGPSLQANLQKALLWEQQQEEEERKMKQQKKSAGDTAGGLETETENATSTAPSGPGRKKRKLETDSSKQQLSPPPKVGGHIRLGWSMRTGDLQAPVGYDKWSYGIRGLGGSIVHKSNRQDAWINGGCEPLHEGDIIGTAICLDPGAAGDESQNHIRFFKNGHGLGEFVISKGKRVGGEAFCGIESGTYYPAVSTYLGGTVRANFGPHFICPPRKVPTGIKLKPLSDLCPAPLSPEDAVTKLTATAKLFRRPEQAQALKDAVQAEAALLCQARELYVRQQVEYVRRERLERGSTVQDLPPAPDAANQNSAAEEAS